MSAKKVKLACILALALIIFALFGAYYIERLRAGELVRLFSDALASYSGSSIVVPHNPAVSLKSGGLKFSNIKFSISSVKYKFTVTVEEADVDIDLLAFGRGNFGIRTLRITHPVIVAEKAQASGAPWYVADKARAHAAKINIQRILVQKGEVILTSSTGKTHLEHVNISANLAGSHEAAVSGDFYLEAKYGREVAGNLAFRGVAHYYAPNLTFRHGAISFTPLSWPLPMPAGPLRIGFDGALNLRSMLLRMASCRLSWPGATLNLKGAAMLASPSISAEFDLEGDPAAEKSGRKEAVSIQGFIERQADDMRLEELEIQVGENTGSAEISLNFPEENGPPAISGAINFGGIDINELPDFLKELFGGLKSGPWPGLNLEIFCKNVVAPQLRGTDLKFLLTGSAGNYQVKDLRLNTDGGTISANLQFILPDKYWKIDALGQNFKLNGVSIPLCAGDVLGKANFSLHALGDDLLEPGKNFTGSLDLDVKDFQCAARSDFLNSLAPEAKNLLAPALALESFTARIILEDNLVFFSPLAAIGKNFSADGKAWLDMDSLSVDARINARLDGKNPAREVSLDFIWPANYFHKK